MGNAPFLSFPNDHLFEKVQVGPQTDLLLGKDLPAAYLMSVKCFPCDG